MTSRLRRALDAGIGFLCRLVLGVFFRRIEIVGQDRIPLPPLLVVANHVNGLIDPLLVLGPLRIPARMLGKSTLWEVPVLAQLLDLAGVIPVYRRQDAGADTGRNRESLDRAALELERGGVVAIFPEGISHDLPHLAPLRTGAARLALEAAKRVSGAGRSLLILPVGLLFEARERFRSRALIVVGEPLAVEVLEAVTPESVRSLTDRIEQALQRVTVGYASWEEARWIELAASILARPTEELPSQRSLAEAMELRKAMASGLEALRVARPEAVERAILAMRRYQAALVAFGIRDSQVVARWPLRLVLRFLARTLLRLLVALPLAVAGTVLHLLPYWTVRALARRMRHEPNQIATYQVFPSLLIYPLNWLLWGTLVTWLVSWRWGVATVLLAPAVGYVALRAHERWRVLVRETRAFLLLARHGHAGRILLEKRREVERTMRELIEIWSQWRTEAPSREELSASSQEEPAGG